MSDIFPRARMSAVVVSPIPDPPGAEQVCVRAMAIVPENNLIIHNGIPRAVDNLIMAEPEISATGYTYADRTPVSRRQFDIIARWVGARWSRAQWAPSYSSVGAPIRLVSVKGDLEPTPNGAWGVRLRPDAMIAGQNPVRRVPNLVWAISVNVVDTPEGGSIKIGDNHELILRTSRVSLNGPHGVANVALPYPLNQAEQVGIIMVIGPRSVRLCVGLMPTSVWSSTAALELSNDNYLSLNFSGLDLRINEILVVEGDDDQLPEIISAFHNDYAE